MDGSFSGEGGSPPEKIWAINLVGVLGAHVVVYVVSFRIHVVKSCTPKFVLVFGTMLSLPLSPSLSRGSDAPPPQPIVLA